MRFNSKHELLQSIQKEHQALVDLASSIPRKRYKEAGVWGDDWTIHDLLAHLTEWEQMCLRWYREGRKGARPALPAAGFKWNETPKLNREIWKKHRRKSTKVVMEDFDASYGEILSVARRLNEEELFAPGHFAWTGENRLVTYLAANTSSHYHTAAKILKRWLKGQKRA